MFEDDFDGLIHTAWCCIKIDLEGDPYNFWGTSPSPHPSPCRVSPNETQETNNDDVSFEFPPHDRNLQRTLQFSEIKALMWDNNKLSPKNIPTGEEPSPTNSGLKEGQYWGCSIGSYRFLVLSLLCVK